MPLDQVRPAVITHDNMNNRVFVVIKHMKRANLKPLYCVSDFKSDHLVNIRDMFLKGDHEIVIVYEQMNVSLRHVMTVTRGSLQVFKIMMICREVSTCTQWLGDTHNNMTAGEQSLLHSWKAFTLSWHAELQHDSSESRWNDQDWYTSEKLVVSGKTNNDAQLILQS